MDGSVCAVLGDRKTGKSVFARELLRAWVRRGALAVYCTPNGAGTDPLEYGEEFSIDRAEAGEPLPHAIALREDPEDVADFVVRAAAKFDTALLLDEAHESLGKGQPVVCIFHTLMMKDVKSFENQCSWHGKPLATDELMQTALTELGYKETPQEAVASYGDVEAARGKYHAIMGWRKPH